MSELLTHADEQALKRTVLRIHERGWGVAFGLVLGLGLFAATNVLVVKGGPTVGPHLGLLRLYFPGYSVSFVGSLVGFVYAFVVGYGIGWAIARIYNRLTSRMH